MFMSNTEENMSVSRIQMNPVYRTGRLLKMYNIKAKTYDIAVFWLANVVNLSLQLVNYSYEILSLSPQLSEKKLSCFFFLHISTISDCMSHKSLKYVKHMQTFVIFSLKVH